LISGAVLVWVRQAQEVTRQRNAIKKAKGKQKDRSKARKESSDESEASLDTTDDEDIEMLDCIEVKM